MLVDGTSAQGGGTPALALARYLPNGMPDASFGVGGAIFTPVLDTLIDVGALAVQPDAKIVVGAVAYEFSASNQLVVLRFLGN